MKLAFVVPWYGLDVVGGAETEARKTAEALQRLAGLEVEVLTTCVRDFYSDWSVNHRPEGLDWVNGVPVRRFPVRARNTKAFDAVNFRLMHGLPVTAEEEATYLGEMIHSPALYDFIRCQGDAYVFFFIPYMFGTTYAGSAIHPERSALIPCLHDEPYAYLSGYREMFRRVRGVAFHTQAELDLARRLYEMRPDAPALVREGVDVDFEACAARFVAKYGVQDFVLYVGRKEAGKNVPLLLEYFGQYKRRYGGELKLVLVGKGAVAIPRHRRHDVLDLGVLSDQDKYDAYAAAAVLCQPSLHESFSLVMMEAWAAGTPVLVHAGCAVTREHCLEANGGLLFSDVDEFAEGLRRLERDAALRRALGQQGRRYVLQHFTWEAVVENYLGAFQQWGWPIERRLPIRWKALRQPQPSLQQARRARDGPDAGARTGRAVPTVRQVHQLVAGFRSGDAISQAAMAIQAALRSWGFASEIFAHHAHVNARHLAFPLQALARRWQPDQVLIYHYSIHSEASELFLRHPGKKILLYHNITPSQFFAGYSERHAWLTRLGRARLAELVQAADLCLGASRFNCLELEACGAPDCRVLPILLDLDALGRIPPDPRVLRLREDDRPTLLYVGRPIPNKRQDDVIRAFAAYRQRFAATARLILVGGSDEADRYAAELRQLVRQLDLRRHVTFAGFVNDAQLVAYYRAAHVFVSMSEHEGFGVPLLEAMFFDLPIIAYAAAAVPYTLGRAGILVRDKDYTAIAQLIHRVVSDDAYRAEILSAQRRRLKDFAPPKVKAMLRLYLDELLEA